MLELELLQFGNLSSFYNIAAKSDRFTHNQGHLLPATRR